LDWVRPELWEQRGLGSGAGAWRLGLERWVIGAGELVYGATGLSLAAAEGAVAAGVVALLFGVMGGIVSAAPRAVSRVLPRIDARWALLASVAAAAGLVFSRHTEGGGRLLIPALVLAWVVTAALAGAVTRGRARVVASITLLASVAALGLAAGDLWADGSAPPVLAALSALMLGLGIVCLGSLRRPARP